MVVLDIICRMKNHDQVLLIDGINSTQGTVEIIKKEDVAWHRKTIEEIHLGDYMLILIVY